MLLEHPDHLERAENYQKVWMQLCSILLEQKVKQWLILCCFCVKGPLVLSFVDAFEFLEQFQFRFLGTPLCKT